MSPKHGRAGQPYVRLKLAASIDGRIAAAPHPSRPDAPGGVSKWITGLDARRRVHALRAQVDAVVVGIGTAIADDPELTVRDVAPFEGRAPPARVVLDSHARLSTTAKLVRTARDVPTIVVTLVGTETRPLEDAGVRVLRVGPADGGLDLAAALDALASVGLVDLLVEGGSRVAGSLVAADLVDEIHWFVAPIALGEHGAPSLVGLAPSAPDIAPRYALERAEVCGNDVELVLVRRISG